MHVGAMLLALVMCGLGLALAFVYFNPWGFVLDGVGFMVFLYAIYNREERQTVIYEDRTSYKRRQAGENYKCHYCMFFGKPGCKNQEQLLNATPCEDFTYSYFKDE